MQETLAFEAPLKSLIITGWELLESCPNRLGAAEPIELKQLGSFVPDLAEKKHKCDGNLRPFWLDGPQPLG